MADQVPGDVREALFDLQRYLSDQLAPMMVADSVEMLLRCPPETVASQIDGWVGSQSHGAARGISVSDYLFHAMKKIHHMAELELIEKEILARYLDELAPIILELCPAAERELLRQNLGRLGQAEATLAATAEIIHRQAGTASGMTTPEGPVPSDVASGMKRLSLLIERLGRSAPSGDAGGGSSGGHAPLETHILANAAMSARTAGELEQRMSYLGELGIDASIQHIFRSLGRGLPGWGISLPEVGAGQPVPVPESRPVKAMHRIASMAENPEDGARYFNEMVLAAIEQFNEGSLGQAATMFDLAKRIIDEKNLKSEIVDSIVGKAHASLSPQALREAADKPDKHGLLRRVLEFFPAMRAKGILTSLDGEKKRDRRKLFLALLEVHGRPARDAALERLEGGSADADPEGFFRRNLIYLMRRIPRPDESDLGKELELLTFLSGLGNPLLVIREAALALGAIDDPRAQKILMTRLREIEDTLMAGGTSFAAEDLVGVLDRVVSALARGGTPNGWRTVVGHAFKQQPQLGDTMARLEALSGQDMSGDKELVSRLVDTIKSDLPTKVLGIIVSKKNPNLTYLIRALSGTPAPAVREVLEDIVSRYKDLDFAEAASEALAGLGVRERPAAESSTSMSGDLELFGLPTLLQSLADSRVTGVLTLSDRNAETTGAISFDDGKIRGCQTGKLRGEAAFYQLFEKPVPGTFAFQSREFEQDDAPVMEVMPLMLEALRRHDELQAASALIPADAALKPTGTQPTPPEDEEDPVLMRAVWARASAGASPVDCEAAVQTDSFRIQRLLAHWVEQGALQAA